MPRARDSRRVLCRSQPLGLNRRPPGPGFVGRRVNELGPGEPLIQRQGLDRILVQVPGLQDPTRLKELLGKTAKMEFRMVDLTVPPDQAQRGGVPPDSEVLPSADSSNPQPYVIKKQVLVSCGDLTDAQPGFD